MASNEMRTISYKSARKKLTAYVVLFSLIFLSIFYVLSLNRTGVDAYSDIPFRNRDDLGDIICLFLPAVVIGSIAMDIVYDPDRSMEKTIKRLILSCFGGMFMYLVFFVTHRGIHLSFVGSFTENLRFVVTNLFGMVLNGLLISIWTLILILIDRFVDRTWFSPVLEFYRFIVMLFWMIWWYLEAVINAGEYFLLYPRYIVVSMLTNSLKILIISVFLLVLFAWLICFILAAYVKNKGQLKSGSVLLASYEYFMRGIQFLTKGKVSEPRNAVRLAAIVTPIDVIRKPSFSLDYYAVVSRFKKMDLIREGGSAEIDDLYLLPYANLEEAETKRNWFEKQIQLYLNGFTDMLLSEEQQKKIIDFLLKKREEGYLVSCVAGPSMSQKYFGAGRSELSMRILDTDIPFTWAYKNEHYLPFGEKHGRDTEKNALFNDLSSLLEKVPDDHIRKTMTEIITECRASDGDAACFYSLLKLGEQIVHILWLRMMASKDTVTEAEITRPSIGRITGAVSRYYSAEPFTEDDAVLSARDYLVEFASKGNKQRSINRKRMRFSEACGLLAELRNRFVGHGVMAYSVTPECVAPMIRFVSWILNVCAKDLELKDTDIIVTANGKRISCLSPNKNYYVFGGYKYEGILNYFSFANGDSYTCDDSNGLRKVRIPIFTEWDGDDRK